MLAYRAGLAHNLLAARVNAAASIADLADQAFDCQAGIRNAAALIAHESGGADNPGAAPIGETQASITNLPDAAHKGRTKIANTAAAVADEAGRADTPLAAGIGNAGAFIANLPGLARMALAKLYTGAIRIAHARGACGAIFRITPTVDARLSGRAGNPCTGV
ncbi:MAG: hypothetical protein MUO24_06435 [Desulfobacterales bacterium]|nr:hypothetical protein [Desulfobacterales bacterium]